MLRGFAIVMMIVNHLGEKLPAFGYRPGGVLDTLVFLGSFAPAVFYFTTGFGIGVSRDRPDPAAARSMLFKAALLVVADQFMWWKDGEAYGLDFLAFIGLSTVLVTLVAYSKRSVWVACGLAMIALVLRFGLGWWLRDRVQLGGLGAWLVGITPLDRVSYPLSPWIEYPLVGYVLARYYRRQLAAGNPRFSHGWLSVTAAGACVCSGILYHRHAAFFRWGTVSIGYFVLSIAVLAGAILLAWSVHRILPRLARIVSLRGMQSLAVVPIHYGLLALLAIAVPRLAGPPAVCAALLAMIVASMSLSNAFASAVHSLNRRVSPEVAVYLFAGTAVICVALELGRASPAMFAAFVAGQLAITGLLSMRAGGQRPVPVLAPRVT
ncbi:MAG TPA: heparan-alpha-glucosaminide N-acetyltransferase domain-containing protein [Steroidobacteraceae bacterium]|nr:heparan-alpha-glucosaminide N-acetyltransferase domain-containing protein [Steroidobacteraceae bacterium]